MGIMSGKLFLKLAEIFNIDDVQLFLDSLESWGELI